MGRPLLRWRAPPPLGAHAGRACVYRCCVTGSPLDPHAATPVQLQQRIAAERRGTPFLLYRDGDAAQVIVELDRARPRLTLGRREGNDVRLGWDPEVSRVHAALELLGDDWFLTDDGFSRNGTWLNGRRVAGRCRLRNGDVIAVGNSTVAFCDPASEPTSQVTRSAHGTAPVPQLSPAQRRVLVALCRPYRDSGYAAPATNREIAEELVVGVDAVKSTLKALFAAFAVDDLPQNQKRATLALQALRTGAVARRDL
jgi:pSer/pThr/pTyr-binding forkhead associated (FHA) protein